VSIIQKAIEKKAQEKNKSSSVFPCDDDSAIVSDRSSVTNSDANRVVPLRDYTNRQLDIGGAKINRLVAEEFRRIKRPLLNNIAGKGATVVDNSNMVMITSALPGEGKTFTTVHLAESIALEREKTVLLIDADSERSTLSRSLGVEREAGLVDYLAGEVGDLSNVVLPTDIDSIKFISAGTPHPHALELFSSDRMQRLADELSGRYPDRIIIFDSPPILVSNEAVVTSALMGQILLVVQAEKSKESDVLDALGMLDSSKIIGVILNRCGNSQHKGYYYSYSDGPAADD